MNTIKKNYLSPVVERVELDHEISLTLDSSMVPFGDPEIMGIMDVPVMSSDPLIL